mmetsp:Transcript_34815/g.82857  ORF Transcript_34815/g.82857 Transcript_34815/m.82857 type:complete len:299 (-) Transcript_34815:110-1006(-)
MEGHDGIQGGHHDDHHNMHSSMMGGGSMMGGSLADSLSSIHKDQHMQEPTQLVVEGVLMKLLAQSPDGTLMCCANETQLKFVDSRFLKLYETQTPGPILAACFHPQKYELFLKIEGRTLIFDLATKEYRAPEETDTMIPPEPWAPPPPPPGAVLSPNMPLGLGLGGEKRRSGSGRPKGSKDKTQRQPRSAAAQEFEKEVVAQLTSFCGDDPSKWNAKKPAIDAIKASAMWETSWTKAGLNEQQLVQFVHRLKAKRTGGKEGGDVTGMGGMAPVGSLGGGGFSGINMNSMYPGSHRIGM